MEKETFSQSAVVDFLNKNYISVRVNTDKNRKLSKQFFVRGLPASWFVSEKGTKISSIPGYIEPQMMLHMLKFIHSDSYKKMNLNEFIKQNP